MASGRTAEERKTPPLTRRVELLGTIALHWKPYRLDKFEWDYHRIPLTQEASVEHRGLPRDGRSWRIRSALAYGQDAVNSCGL